MDDTIQRVHYKDIQQIAVIGNIYGIQQTQL